jgi:hypothetical protein
MKFTVRNSAKALDKMACLMYNLSVHLYVYAENIADLGAFKWI